MSTNVTWNGTTYAIPAAGEVNWPALSNFLIALGDNAAVAEEMKQAVRVATTTPVTVSNTTDCVVVTNLGVAGAVAVNLPAGTTGRIFYVVDGKGDAGTNNITITPNGAEQINGAATYVIGDNRGGIAIAWNGTGWNVISRNIAGSLLTNPMDSAGDMIYGASGGAATKLDSGSSGQLLMANGAAAPTWVDTITGGKTFSAVVAMTLGWNVDGGATFNKYVTGSFTATFTQSGGFSQAVTVSYARVGIWCFLEIPAFDGSATATAILSSGATDVPSAVRPVVQYRAPCQVAVNTVDAMGVINVTTAGQITIGATLAGGNFTSGQNARFGGGGTTNQTFTYRVAAV